MEEKGESINDATIVSPILDINISVRSASFGLRRGNATSRWFTLEGTNSRVVLRWATTIKRQR